MKKLLKRIGINTKHVLLAILAMVTVIYIFVAVEGKMYSNKVLTDDDFTTLRSWIDTSSNVEVLLPHNFNYTGEDIVLKKTLDMNKAFESTPHILIKSKYYDYKLYLDDELIYQYENPKDGFTKTTGTQVRIVRVGDYFKGKTLRLVITPLLGDEIQYSVIPPVLGGKTDIIWSSIKSEQAEVIMDVLIIIFGVILLFLSIFMRGKRMGDKMFFLGILSIICAIYMGCQYRVTHIISTNSYLQYYSEYVSLLLIPLVTIMFVRASVYGKARNLCDALMVVSLVNVVGQNIMNFIFGIEFRVMLSVTHFMIVLLAVVVIICIITLKKEKHIVYMLLSILPAILGGIVDLVLLREFAFEKVVFFFPIGMYIFVGMQSGYTIKEYMEYTKSVMHSEIYEKLAFTDGLTGLYNRLAFENDINERINDKKPACISIDLNNLKLANDTMGHSMGDVLIKGMAIILTEAVSQKGKIYRIGGDEFIVLIPDTDREDMQNLLNEIENCKKEYNRENRINIDFAIGVSYFDNEDESFETLVTRADLKMYKNKRRAKGQDQNDV